MLFRRERQTSRGSEIERAGIARDLPDHEGKIAAAQPLFQREQRIGAVFRRNVDKAVAQPRRQSVAIGTPAQANGGAILHPQPGTLVGRIGRRICCLGPQRILGQGQRHPCPAGLASGRENLAVTAGIRPSRTPLRIATPPRQGGKTLAHGRLGPCQRDGKRGGGHDESTPMFLLCSHTPALAIRS
jgi:hypothetical protein